VRVEGGVEVAIASGWERYSTVRARSDMAVAQGVLQSHEVSTELCDIAHSVHDDIGQGIHGLVGRHAPLRTHFVVDEGVSFLEAAVLVEGVGLD
jgi:hypothetical protein